MTRKHPEPEVFVLLGKRRRRQVLQILRESSTPLTIIELARHIADREHEDPSTTDVRTIHLTLYHNHLPRLAEADVVDYNEDVGTVSPGLAFDTLIRTLEAVSEADLPWSGE